MKKPILTICIQALILCMLLLISINVSLAYANNTAGSISIVGNGSSATKMYIDGPANYTFASAEPGYNTVVNFSVKISGHQHGLYNISTVSGNLSGNYNESNRLLFEIFKQDKGIVPKGRVYGEPFFINVSKGERENPYTMNATNATEPGQTITLVWAVTAVGPAGYNWSFFLRSSNGTTYLNQSATLLHDIVLTLAPPTPDTNNPAYQNFTLNDTNAKLNFSIKWSAYLTDDVSAGNYICGYNNGTLWANQSSQSWVNGTTVNCASRINSSAGTNISVQIYFTDATGNGNKTNELSFIVSVDADPYALNFALNDTNAKFNDSIKWSAQLFDDVAGGGYSCGYNNGSAWWNFTGGSWTNTSTVNCIQRVNSTRGTNFSVQIYFSDTNGFKNKTNELSFIVADTSPIWASNISNKTLNENSGLQLYETITNFCTDADGDSVTYSVQSENTAQADITTYSGNSTIYVNPATNYVGTSSPIIGCTANSVLANTSFVVTVTDQNPPAFGGINTTAQNTTYGQLFSINITWFDTQGVRNVEFNSNYTGSWKAYGVYNISGNRSMDYTINFSAFSVRAGLMYFNFSANDSNGNKNQTSIQTLNISKAVPIVKLYINGTNGDKTLNFDAVADFSINLSVGQTQQKVTVQLWTNLSQANLKLWDSGLPLLINITPLSGYATGRHRIFANVSETENMTSSSEGPFVLTISGISLTVAISNNGNFSLINFTSKNHKYGNFKNQSDTVGIFNITVNSNTTVPYVDVYARINTTFILPLNISYFPQVSNSSNFAYVINLTTTYQRVLRNISTGSTNNFIWGFISLYNATPGMGTHFVNISYFSNFTNYTYTTNRTYIAHQWLFEGREVS